VEHDVQHPVQAVLGVPVAAHGAGEQAGVEGQGGVSFQAGCAASLDLGFHHGDGAHAGEAGCGRGSGGRR